MSIWFSLYLCSGFSDKDDSFCFCWKNWFIRFCTKFWFIRYLHQARFIRYLHQVWFIRYLHHARFIRYLHQVWFTRYLHQTRFIRYLHQILRFVLSQSVSSVSNLCLNGKTSPLCSSFDGFRVFSWSGNVSFIKLTLVSKFCFLTNFSFTCRSLLRIFTHCGINYRWYSSHPVLEIILLFGFDPMNSKGDRHALSPATPPPLGDDRPQDVVDVKNAKL